VADYTKRSRARQPAKGVGASKLLVGCCSASWRIC